MADYYKILGVPQNASGDEIKRAYRLAVKKYHPDLHSNATPEQKKEFEAKTKEINEAYSVLSDPRQRAAYDNSNFGGGYSGYSGGQGQNSRRGGYGGYSGRSGGWQDYGFSDEDFKDFFGRQGRYGGTSGNYGNRGTYSGKGGFSSQDWDDFWQQGSPRNNPYRRQNGRNNPFDSLNSTSLLSFILYTLFGRRFIFALGILLFLFIFIFWRFILYFLIIYFVFRVLKWAIKTIAGN